MAIAPEGIVPYDSFMSVVITLSIFSFCIQTEANTAYDQMGRKNDARARLHNDHRLRRRVYYILNSKTLNRAN